MKIYTFPVRVAGTNIFVSHINDIQSSINYLSKELTNGIGTESDPRVFKVAAAATGYASFNIPPAGGTPSAPASGDVWNDAGTLKLYNGTTTKSIAFTDGVGDVSSNTATSVDSEVALFSGVGGKTIKRASISGLAKLASGVLSSAEITGTTNQITVTNGTGVSGNPSLALSSTAVAPGTFATTGWFGVKTTSAYSSSDMTIGDATDGDLWLAMRGKDSSNAELRLVQGVWNGNDRGFMGTATAHGFAFRTSNLDRFTLDSSGNVTFEQNMTVKGSTTLATTLTGPLKAASGVVSASAVNLASEVTGTLPWGSVSKTGSNLTDIATRSHTALTDIGTNSHADIDTALTRLANTSGTNTGDQVVPANTTSTAKQYFTAYNSTTGAFTKTQPSITDLSDVNITSVADNQVLTWDSATSKWVNENASGGSLTLDGLTDVTTPSPATGEYLRWNGSQWVDAHITGAWTVTFGDGTNAIATGYQIPVVYVPYDHVVTAHTILVPSGTTAVTGSLAVQVRRQPIANYPTTTNLTTIFTPTLSSQSIVTTTGLSTAVSAGIYRFNVTTATPTLTKVAIIFEFYRTT